MGPEPQTFELPPRECVDVEVRFDPPATESPELEDDELRGLLTILFDNG